MGLLHNVQMALSGRAKHWDETSNAAFDQLYDYFGVHFSEEYALRSMFQHFLTGSALSVGQMIYERNPRKSLIQVEIKSLNIRSMVHAHIIGTQLYGTIFSYLNPDTMSLEVLHMIFSKVFPDVGVISSIASCASGAKFDLLPYSNTFVNELSGAIGVKVPSSFSLTLTSVGIVGGTYESVISLINSIEEG